MAFLPYFDDPSVQSVGQVSSTVCGIPSPPGACALITLIMLLLLFALGLSSSQSRLPSSR